MKKLLKYKNIESIDRLLLDIMSDKSKTKDYLINAGLLKGVINIKCKKPKITFKDLIKEKKKRYKNSKKYQLYVEMIKN